MRTTQWRAQAGLIDRLLARPYKFNFFQALRLLEIWLERARPANDNTLDGVLRFKNSVALSFPPSQIEAVTVLHQPMTAGSLDDEALDQQRLHQVRVTPAFMGFLGVNGVLPFDYTATIAAQISIEKNEAGRAFFDSFSHRSMLLFYRAWSKCRIEYRGGVDNHDSLLAMQLAFAGVARRQRVINEHCVPAEPLQSEAIARYAALIRHRPVQAEMLVGVLSEYFAIPVRCQTFVGAWVSLDAGNVAALGVQNNLLGRDIVLGDRFWRRDATIRLWLGPLERAAFDSFLEGHSAAKALKAMLALFAPPTVAFEVRPILRAADVQPALLDGRTALGQASIMLPSPRTPDHEGASYRITFSQE